MEFEENKANKTDLETTASSRERVGIGGLLILALIWLILITLNNLIAKMITIIVFYRPFSLYKIVTYEAIIYTFLIVFSSIIFINFFKKKRFVPTMMIIFSISFVIVILIEFIIDRFFYFTFGIRSSASLIEVAYYTVTCILMVLYFKKSKRVQNTFIRL